MSENRDSERKPEQKPKPILPPKKPQGSTGSTRKDNTSEKTNTKRK